MNEPANPEDPIWSRWRERHGQRSAPIGPATERPGNGAPEPRVERIRLGDPLGPDWAGGPGAGAGQGETAGQGGAAGQAETRAHPHGGRECLEWCPICRTADVVKATVPPELRNQLEGVQRDALVAMRALLDSYIDRLDGQTQGASRVEDIPIS